MIRNNQAQTRRTYEKLLAEFPGKEVAPHYLRFEAWLKNNVNSYRWNCKTTGGESVTEVKLDTNDLFYVKSILVGTINCEPGKEAVAKIETFAGTDDLEAIYNGALQLKTGSKVNIEKLMGLNFKYIPENNGFNFQDAAYSGVEDIYLFGTKTHELTYDFPTKAGMSIEKKSEDAPENYKLVVILDGFIVKNGAIDTLID